MTARIALVTARAARELDEDLAPLLAAFESVGARADVAVWDDPQVEWGSFDAALLRSAWDYTERIDEFLRWVQRAAAVTQLLNPPAVVRWNCDKHYLRELAGHGLPVITSEFLEPGADAQALLHTFLAQNDCASLVVKPAVGAGSRDARRHARTANDEILGHMRPLLTAGRAILMQPYLPSVDRAGETSLVYIEGEFSHAFRKGPLLPLGAGSTDALFAAEEISARTPAADELEVGRRILGSIPFGRLLYARVDLIRGEDAGPRLLELELTEPSLYFKHGAGSAELLARSTLARLAGR